MTYELACFFAAFSRCHYFSFRYSFIMHLSALPLDGSLSLREFVEIYLRIRAHQLRSIHSVGCCLRRLAGRLPAVPIAQLRRVDISEYIAIRQAEGRTAKTINVELLNLSAALNYAKKHWGWHIENPISGQYLRVSDGRLRYLSQQEAFRLLAIAKTLRGIAGDVLPDFIALALNTGMRKTELLRLKWAQVNDNRITLEPEITKNCKRRIVPLNATAMHVLGKRRGRVSPFVFGTVDNLYPTWHHICNLANLDDFRIHDLRHTFASWLVLAGVPLLEVRDLLGHSSIKMTERYAHLSQDALVKAVAVLDQVQLYRHWASDETSFASGLLAVADNPSQKL
jgi:integrase